MFSTSAQEIVWAYRINQDPSDSKSNCVEQDVVSKNALTPIYPICTQLYMEHPSGVMKW